MAARAIFRRNKLASYYFNPSSTRSLQSFQSIADALHSSDSRCFSCPASYHFNSDDRLRETVKKAECFGFSGVRNVGYCFNGSLVGPRFVDGRFRLGDGILVRYASTVAVKRLPPEYDSDDEEGKEMVGKKRKEASADECDQAVEGLSSAKAKAKAKRLNESMKAEKSVLQRTWAALLGLGPALRAVASMSRLKT